MTKTKFWGLAALCLLPVAVNAQSFQDASQTNAAAVRDPARQSSTGIDAVIYNPAGTALLSDGWHFSLNANLATQHMEESSFGRSNRNFALNVNPSLQSAYKKNRLTLSLSLGNEGGYGVWYENENSMLAECLNAGLYEEFFSSFTSMAKTLGTGSEYDRLYRSATVSGHLYNFTGRIGAAYRIDDHWSVYAGLRANYYHEGTRTRVRQFVRTSDGNLVSVNKYFTDLASESDDLADVYLIFKNAAASRQTIDLVDESNAGWGLSPVIGVDYRVGNFNFGAKYEFETKVRVGRKGRSFHVPSVLSGGVSWQILDNLKASVGGSWQHQKISSVIGGNQRVYSSDSFLALNMGEASFSSEYRASGKNYNGWDLSASLTFKPTDRLAISMGYTYDENGKLFKDIYPQSIFLHKGHRDVVSGGLNYAISDMVQLDLGIRKSMTTTGYENNIRRWNGGQDATCVSAGININL